MQLYSLLLGLGAIAGLLLAGWRAPNKEAIRYVDAAAIALFLALVGSRAGFVAVNWDYYAAHPLEILEVWQGGLSSIGALAGAALAVVLLAAWWKLPAGLIADIFLPLAACITITSWLGCWAGSCAYGQPSSDWWALPARDEWGVFANRLPVQLIGAILTLLLLVLLDWLARRVAIRGLAGCLGLFGISAILFGLSYLRADPSLIYQGLRLEAWGAIAMMGLSGLLVVVLLVRGRLRKSVIPLRGVTS